MFPSYLKATSHVTVFARQWTRFISGWVSFSRLTLTSARILLTAGAMRDSFPVYQSYFDVMLPEFCEGTRNMPTFFIKIFEGYFCQR